MSRRGQREKNATLIRSLDAAGSTCCWGRLHQHVAMKRVSQLAEHVTKSAQPNLAAVEAEVVEVDEGQVRAAVDYSCLRCPPSTHALS